MKFAEFSCIQGFCEAVGCHLGWWNVEDINDGFLNEISNVMIADFNMVGVTCDLLVFADCNCAVIINEKGKDEIGIDHFQFLQDVMYTDDFAESLWDSYIFDLNDE